MIKHHLLTTFRSLRRHTGYAALNIIGLAVGIACCLLIGLYVWHESSYDDFHEKGDRLYRLTYESRLGSDLPPATPDQYRVWGSAAFAPMLEADFPEIEHAVRLSGRHSILLNRGEEAFQEERYFFADSAFFDVFSFPLLDGNPATALARPNQIILTEQAAERYFGDADPMGQTLFLNTERPVVVTGVMADLPANTHIDFDILLSMDTFREVAPDYMFDNWGYVDFFTYVLLRENQSEEALEAKFPAFIERRIGDGLQDPPRTYNLALEPVAEAYLSPIPGFQTGPKGSQTNLYLFSFIGFFILLIAVVNFMNLTTARSTQRAKEVGVRKAVGALRQGLVGQFLVEAFVLVLVATAIAFLLTDLVLPLFRNLAGKTIPSTPLREPGTLLLIGVGILGVSLLAGSYPAAVLSAFRPAQVLKGAFSSSQRGVALRKGLVVFQFGTAVALIAGTLIVWQQLDYLRSQPLGFDAEQQLMIDFGGDDQVLERIESVKRELAAHPAVLDVAATRSVPGGYFPYATTNIELPTGGELEEFIPGLFEIDFDFLPQLEVEMAAGRVFDPAFSSDSTAALILNESATRELGYADPAEAIGKRFDQWGREGQIIGVVKNFNHESLHQSIAPLTFRISPFLNYVVLRVASEDIPQTVADLEARWAQVAPHRPFLYSFLDDDFDALYRAEDRFGRLFGVFAMLAIFVACLGLFGLATHATQQRIKEIGVRKVLGASVPGLVMLLSQDFIKLVGLAFLVAAPAIWFGMSRWLDGFAYRVSLGPGLFLLAGFLALTIALLTVSYQAIKAARANPVEALRYE